MSDSPASTHVFPLEAVIPHVPGVPHSFGVGILMILVTMFAVLFAVMQSMDAKPPLFIVVTVLFVGVAVGQSLLFGGRRPRRASLWIGGLLLPTELCVWLLYLHATSGEWSRFRYALPDIGRFLSHYLPMHMHIRIPLLTRTEFLGVALATGWIIGIPLGIFFGYCAGTLTAGVFWFMERRKLQAATRVLPDIELHPFTAADLATLIEWMRNDSLAKHWAGSQFTLPLELPQLQGRLAEADAEPPTRYFFKLVDKTSGLMVAYAELGRIDRKARAATLELAVVDPAAPQRAALSLQLLRTVIGRAFGDLQLLRLGVLLPDDQARTLGCYRAAGFCKLGHEPAVYRLEVVSTAGL